MSRLKIMRDSLFISLLLAGLINVPTYAELVPLYGSELFVDMEGLLEYPAQGRRPIHRLNNMHASELESRNGIIFTGEGESTVRIHQDRSDLYFGAWVEQLSCIEHVPSSGASSAGEGLVIKFKYPVSRFGIHLGIPTYGVSYFEGFDTATLRAYADNGQFIGEMAMTTASPYEIFGFATSGGPGVSTVIMDYGDADAPERIDTVYYEYSIPRPFKVILPQIAHGTMSGVSIECDLTVFWDDAATVKVFSPEGTPLTSQILDHGNEFILASEARKDPQEFFKSSTISGLENLTVGYVAAESDYPIDGQVVYRTTDAEGKVYEADIRGCVPETYLEIPFEINESEKLNAALAIVNTSDTAAEIEIHVNDDEESYTEFWYPPTLILEPGEQKALFMWELWDEMPSADGNYILQLRSAVPFAAAAFYTRNWIVVGNLPVWSYQEGQAR